LEEMAIVQVLMFNKKGGINYERSNKQSC
jgi:hypothetical protein